MAKSLTRIDSNFTPFLRDRSSLAIKKKGFCILEYLASTQSFFFNLSNTCLSPDYPHLFRVSLFLTNYHLRFLSNKFPMKQVKKIQRFPLKSSFLLIPKSQISWIFSYLPVFMKSQRILPLVLKFVFQWEHMFVWSDLNHQNANWRVFQVSVCCNSFDYHYDFLYIISKKLSKMSILRLWAINESCIVVVNWFKFATRDFTHNKISWTHIKFCKQEHTTRILFNILFKRYSRPFSLIKLEQIPSTVRRAIKSSRFTLASLNS